MTESLQIDPQHQKLVESIDAARQAEADATGRAPYKAEFRGSSDERIELPDFGGPSIGVNRSSNGDEAISGLVSTTRPGGGANHYVSGIRDYDHDDQPRTTTNIVKTDEKGNVVYEHRSHNPKLARQAGIVAARAVKEGFEDPEAEKARRAATPDLKLEDKDFE